MPSESTKPMASFARSAFQKYAPALHRFLVRRIRRPQEIDDLSQEVFARLLRVEKAEIVRKPASYLFGIAANVVREFRIRAEHDHDRVTFDSRMVEYLAEHPFEAPDDDMADRLSLRRQLERGLAQLPRTHRVVLLMVTRDGLSHEEAAKAAKLSVHTVEKYVTDARARLKLMKWDR
jgi:RNA polymerase sigma-70 factor (ECF subfamily)